MIRSQPQLSEATIAFLNSEAAKFASATGFELRELRLVESVYSETDARKKGFIPIWTKLYAGLDPKEQSFAIALYYASKADEGSQITEILKVCGLTICCVFLALPFVRYPLISFALLAVSQVIFWGGLFRMMPRVMRTAFQSAVDLTGDMASGQSYLLKRRAVMMGSDPSDVVTNPRRYVNWLYRACVPPEYRVGL